MVALPPLLRRWTFLILVTFVRKCRKWQQIRSPRGSPNDPKSTARWPQRRPQDDPSRHSSTWTSPHRGHIWRTPSRGLDSDAEPGSWLVTRGAQRPRRRLLCDSCGKSWGLSSDLKLGAGFQEPFFRPLKGDPTTESPNSHFWVTSKSLKSDLLSGTPLFGSPFGGRWKTAKDR